MGVQDEVFLDAISSFSGASRRLEKIGEDGQKGVAVFKDFAHSPSKLKATIAAVKEQYPDRKLVACMELHTFSSLSQAFFPQYRGCMSEADVPVVYFNPKAVEHKRLAPISEKMVSEAFGQPGLQVFSDSAAMVRLLEGMEWRNANLLWMSSGNFDGVDEKLLADRICNGK